VNQTFEVPSLATDEAAEALALAINTHDPGATVLIDLRAQLVRVGSAMPAEAIAGCIAAAGHRVSTWVEEVSWSHSRR
jgi:hypothetical protein